MNRKEKEAIDQILAERQKTHGSFYDHSYITQSLKSVARCHKRWSELRSDQKEAIEMTLHKIGRILAGNPDVIDHWDDICGYNKLVADRLRQEVQA